MTLANIMMLALRQLDEAAEDIAEYDEAFRRYANMGYAIAVRQFLRPRELCTMETDARGCAKLDEQTRVIELRNARGEPVRFSLGADGETLETAEACAKLHALCEVGRPPMERDTDEPRLPEYVQPALADYICYRHLSSGSLAKQSRAEFFLQRFYQQMRTLRPQGEGSVTRMRNLYTVTDARYRG